jgi:hypothetical protein
MTMTGGCLCGALRYAIEGEPALAGKCYCTDCRKETGTGHMTFLSFPADAVTFSGEASRFTRPGGSGEDVIRVFCPTCGTTVAGYPTAMGDVVAIRAGTLDDASAVRLRFAVFARHAPAWDAPPAGLLTFPEMPPR